MPSTKVITMLTGLAILMAACGSDESGAPHSDTEDTVDPATTPTSARATSPSSTSPNSTSAQPGTTGVVDPALQPLIDAAVSDLAGRLGIREEDVAVISAEMVVWPDTALGCPRPGMRYLQVPQDGSRIVLEAAGSTYRYHTGGSTTTPFLCEEPAKGAPPTTLPGVPGG